MKLRYAIISSMNDNFVLDRKEGLIKHIEIDDQNDAIVDIPRRHCSCNSLLQI